LPCKSRSPPGALSKKASPSGEAFVFRAFENACCELAQQRRQSIIAYDDECAAIVGV